MVEFFKFPEEPSLKRNYNLALHWVEIRDNITQHAIQTELLTLKILLHTHLKLGVCISIQNELIPQKNETLK